MLSENAAVQERPNECQCNYPVKFTHLCLIEFFSLISVKIFRYLILFVVYSCQIYPSFTLFFIWMLLLLFCISTFIFYLWIMKLDWHHQRVQSTSYVMDRHGRPLLTVDLLKTIIRLCSSFTVYYHSGYCKGSCIDYKVHYTLLEQNSEVVYSWRTRTEGLLKTDQ